MIACGQLAGRTIVVTRPLAQSGPLADAIAAAGGTPLVFPLLDIAPATDLRSLADALAKIETYSLAVFISPNAVTYAVPAILRRGPWPSSLTPAAVGQGTVKALVAHGIAGCVAPTERFDSEALLALPELATERVGGRQVVIFRGDGGRELLADTLRERGATVDCATCYQRRGPANGFEALLDAWRAGRLDGITVSSSEGLRYLVEGLSPEGRQFLEQTPIFVPHARIAESARALGLPRVKLTGAADEGLLAGLIDHDWSEADANRGKT